MLSVDIQYSDGRLHPDKLAAALKTDWNPQEDHQRAMKEACSHGQTWAVEQLLPVSDLDADFLYHAVNGGHQDTVDYLWPYFVRDTERQQALWLASLAGDRPMVDHLLGKVDPRLIQDKLAYALDRRSQTSPKHDYQDIKTAIAKRCLELSLPPAVAQETITQPPRKMRI